MEGLDVTMCGAGIFIEELAEHVAHKRLDMETAIEVMKSALYYVGDVDWTDRYAVWESGEEYLRKCIAIEEGIVNDH